MCMCIYMYMYMWFVIGPGNSREQWVAHCVICTCMDELARPMFLYHMESNDCHLLAAKSAFDLPCGNNMHDVKCSGGRVLPQWKKRRNCSLVPCM